MDLIYSVKSLSGLLHGISRFEKCLSAHSDFGLFTEVFKAVGGSMGGNIYYIQFAVLPFSLSSAPRIPRCLGEALAPLRLKKIVIIPYLDDLLLVGPSAEWVSVDLEVALSFFLKNLWWSQRISHRSLTIYGIHFLRICVGCHSPKDVSSSGKHSTAECKGSEFTGQCSSVSAKCHVSIGVNDFSHSCGSLRSLSSGDCSLESLDRMCLLPDRVKLSLWCWRNIHNVYQGLLWTSPMVLRLNTNASAWGGLTCWKPSHKEGGLWQRPASPHIVECSQVSWGLFFFSLMQISWKGSMS